METGYILLELNPGMKRRFLQEVNQVKGVMEAWLVIGIFDAIVMIKAETVKELEEIYFNKIDKLSGIANSRLHFVACPRTRK